MKKPIINPQIIKRLKTFFAIVQDSDTATRNIDPGKYVIWKNVPCQASTAIASGDTLAIGTNLAADNDGFVNALNGIIAWKHHNKVQGTTINIPSNALAYKVIVSYGISSGEQSLCYVFDFLNSYSSFHGKTLTQGYALPNGNGFCQLSVNMGTYQLTLTGFYVNGTDYKDTCYLDVFYR